MDHEVILRPHKICDWMLNSSQNHFGLHQGKNVRVIMGFGVSKRHILRHALSTNMLQWVLRWERQKRCSSRKRQRPMIEKWCYNKILMRFFVEREDEDKRRQKNGQTCIPPPSQTALSGHVLKKSTHLFFGAWLFLLVHIWFTPSAGPKGFINWIC